MAATFDETIEQSVIACVLKNGIAYEEIVDDIAEYGGSKVFWWTSHQMIWKAFEKLSNNDQFIDTITLINQLDKNGQLEAIMSSKNPALCGREYINHIFNLNVNPENIEAYFGIVKEAYGVRKLIELKEWNDGAINKGKPLNEIIVHNEGELSKITGISSATTKGIVDFGDALVQHAEKTSKAVETKTSPYIPTGLSFWDDIFGGVYPGRIYMLAGATGEGKSTLAQNILYRMAIGDKYVRDYGENVKVGYISFEMTANEIISRLYQMRMSIDSMRIESGKLQDDEYKFYINVSDEFSKKKKYVVFDESTEMTIANLRVKIRKMKEDGVKLVIIDQLEQILVPNNMNKMNLADIYNWIGYRLKAFAGENDISIILLHQTNRSADGVNAKKDVEVNNTVISQGGTKGMNGIAVIRNEREGQTIKSTTFNVTKHRHGKTGKFEIEFVPARLWFKAKAEVIPDAMKTDFELKRQEMNRSLPDYSDKSNPFPDNLEGDY